MKRVLLLLFFAVLCYGAAAQGPVVTIVNETGYTIEYLYVSSNNSDQWEEDLLGRKVLENGKSFQITLPETGGYDFKGVDKDKDSYYKWNVVVRGNLTVTLTPDDYEPDDERPEAEIPYVFTDSPASGSTWVTVMNNTGYDIYYLYVSLNDADDWYSDILKEDILEKGKEVRVMLPRAGTWDFKAVDVDDDDYTKVEVSLKQGANRVVFQASDRD